MCGQKNDCDGRFKPNWTIGSICARLLGRRSHLRLPGRFTISTQPKSQITQLLDAVRQGDVSAEGRLWELIYDELHAVAKRQVAGDGKTNALPPTVLVNEAYLRLLGAGADGYADRRHFFATAAKVMRHIRIDDARIRRRAKRGGGERPVPLFDEAAAIDQDPAEMLAIDEALKRLEKSDKRKAEVVMMRYFVGMTVEETAEALEVSPRSVVGDWRLARAWLHRELSKGDSGVR